MVPIVVKVKDAAKVAVNLALAAHRVPVAENQQAHPNQPEQDAARRHRVRNIVPVGADVDDVPPFFIVKGVA